MKTFFNSTVIQGYRENKTPWNGPLGHKGVDLNYTFEQLYSPITGTVKAVITQVEMGRCIYVTDVRGNIHVFAHMTSSNVGVGDQVNRETLLGITGNTGTKTTGPHLHYEVVTRLPQTVSDMIMVRWLPAAHGFNTDPLGTENNPGYLRKLYLFYGVPIE